MDTDRTFRFRARNANPSYSALFAVALPLFLAACGGASGGSTDGVNSAGTSNAATLAWDPPAGTTDVSGYRLYYGTASGSYMEGIDVGNVTSYTLLGLNSATRFYFAVTAMDSSGNESIYSNEAFKDVP